LEDLTVKAAKKKEGSDARAAKMQCRENLRRQRGYPSRGTAHRKELSGKPIFKGNQGKDRRGSVPRDLLVDQPMLRAR